MTELRSRQVHGDAHGGRAVRLPCAGDTAHLTYDPLTERNHQACFFGERDEGGWANDPPHGMPPTQERFSGHDSAGLGRDFRLKPQLELTGSNRTAQIVFELEPFLHGVGHLATEELDRVTAPLLCSGHRSFGVREQIVHATPVVGPHADTDTRSDIDLRAIQPHRFFERFENSRGQRPRFDASSNVVDQHNKLVASEASERVI